MSRMEFSLVNTFKLRDFSGGPVVRNPPADAGDTGSIPGSGMIPHASE